MEKGGHGLAARRLPKIPRPRREKASPRLIAFPVVYRSGTRLTTAAAHFGAGSIAACQRDGANGMDRCSIQDKRLQPIAQTQTQIDDVTLLFRLGTC